MYYQGENIQINVTSDAITNLVNKDFKLLVYPHYDRNNTSNMITLDKSSATETTAGEKTTYSFNIPYTTTASSPTGDYDIEILVKDSGTFRSIFQKSFAFTLGFANSKNVTN